MQVNRYLDSPFVGNGLTTCFSFVCLKEKKTRILFIEGKVSLLFVLGALSPNEYRTRAETAAYS